MAVAKFLTYSVGVEDADADDVEDDEWDGELGVKVSVLTGDASFLIFRRRKIADWAGIVLSVHSW